MSIVENIEMKFVVVFVIIFGCFINVRSMHFKVDDTFTELPCILMDIDASFNLTFMDGRNEKEAPLFTIEGANIDNSSNCGFLAPVSILSLRLFSSGELLKFTFERHNGTVLMAIQLRLQPKKHFKNISTITTTELTDMHHLPIENESVSFLCKTGETMTFKGEAQDGIFFMEMNIKYLHVQAYNIRGNAFGPAAECSQDLRTSTLPPETTIEPHSETTTPPESTTELQPNTTAEPSPNTTTARKTTTHWQPETTSKPHSSSTTEPKPLTTNTTNEPKPETTTETQPETTTETQPETTTETKPETTTEQQHESTTSISVDTSTAPERGTTTMMTPTSSKSPNTPNKYVVRDKDKVCIVLEGDMIFDIPFQKVDGTTATMNITIPNDVKVSGSCSYNGTGSAQEITLTFFNTSWVLDIVIAKEGHAINVQDTKTYSWQTLRLSYVLDVHFPNAKLPGQKVQAVADGTFGKFKAKMDGSYKCNAEQGIEFGKHNKIKMYLIRMQYRAFGKTNSTDSAKTDVSVCSADNTGGNSTHAHVTLIIVIPSLSAGVTVIVAIVVVFLCYKKKKKMTNGLLNEFLSTSATETHSECYDKKMINMSEEITGRTTIQDTQRNRKIYGHNSFNEVSGRRLPTT